MFDVHPGKGAALRSSSATVRPDRCWIVHQDAGQPESTGSSAKVLRFQPSKSGYIIHPR
jgi:hypothetical protein